MNKSFILCLLALLVLTHSAVTVNTVTGVTDQNLVFSGTIPVSNNNLFFTYYGVDGVKDQNSLKSYPLIIFVGSPGNSAQYYSLGGVGPMTLNNDMTLKSNTNRMTNKVNLMFLDLVGSGFSFTAKPEDISTQAKTYGEQLTVAVNAFAKESVLGQSKTIVIAGEGTFIRSLPGLNDIDALQGIIHLSPWPQFYAMGLYYGIAGPELKIFGQSQRVAIDSTFSSCYLYQRNSKFLEAHQCLDSLFNFVQSRTKNTNLFDVRQGYNLTQFVPMIQYYFSQASVVSQWKAPTTRLFESQAGYVANKTYVDMAKNYTKDISQFMKDYFSVRHIFLTGTSDYIAYFKGIRNWVQNQLNFVERDAFKKAKLEDIVVDGKIIGYSKAVKQVAYAEILNAGHYTLHDQSQYLSPIITSWVESLGDMLNMQTE